MVATAFRGTGAEVVPGDNRQILTFLLNGQEYGLELIRVQEIRGYTPITAIPNLPAYIKGLMDLRGALLPVVDMRLKFGMPPVEYTKFTVIIIARSIGRNLGLIVDSVSDVISASAEKIQMPPDFGTLDVRFVGGILKSNDRLAVLLDLDRLFADDEIAAATRSINKTLEAEQKSA